MYMYIIINNLYTLYNCFILRVYTECWYMYTCTYISMYIYYIYLLTTCMCYWLMTKYMYA